MRESHLRFLACPACRSALAIASRERTERDQVLEGSLACSTCEGTFPIVRGVPRFVPTDNYAASFGLEWVRHARTQYDGYCGVRVSETRFFEETGWPRDLRGDVILEVGSGSGRFTEHAASTGASVVSMDYSYAVDANFASNGGRENVLVVQADVYQMPFRPASFDRAFCFGVLQHTPDVRAAFMAIPPMVRGGGSVVADVYKDTFPARVLGTKYYVRPLTRRIDPRVLYRLTQAWVDALWPLTRLVSRIPRIGPSLNWRLLVPDYRFLGLPEPLLKEWAYLDAFDMLAPRYDTPQTLTTVRRWFDEAGLVETEVRYGYNGVQGRGRVPGARLESTSAPPLSMPGLSDRHRA